MKTKTKLIRYRNIFKNISWALKKSNLIERNVENMRYDASCEMIIYIKDGKIHKEDASWLRDLWYMLCIYEELG